MSPTRRTLRRAALAAIVGAALLVNGAAGAASALAASGSSAPQTIAAASTSARAPRAAANAAIGDARPNIVLITTDDEAMSDMAWMPRTRRLLGRAGITFPNSLSPHPLCCPARAEILTGQYAQNNGVRSNQAEYLGGFSNLRSDDTIATWLSAAGYRTAFVGKYLNGYSAVDDGREPGWDVWNPTTNNVYGYFDYTMFNDGSPRRYRTLHNADLVGRKSVDYIREFATSDAPFFIWASQVAPHGACAARAELSCWSPPLPAKRHAALFAGVQSPSVKDPAFNEADMSDKPEEMRSLPRRRVARINQIFRQRIRSLQAVDEANAATIRALRDTGELDHTVVLMTSDNGYLLGEHRKMDKNNPYEQALQVPLLVRGPGIPAGQTRPQMALTIDLAPTFLDLAHADATLPVDGRSLLPFLAGPTEPGPDTVLIQAGPRRAEDIPFGWSWRGVRTGRYTFVRHLGSDELELYDRQLDPAQLENVAARPEYAAVRLEMARRLELLAPCSGPACRQQLGTDPEPLPVP